jgi:two-component system chemotaxis response regulator CheY
LARKILLADDSVTAQNMGRKILADAGYEVIAVNNGSAALKKIAELKPDLVILDVYMPGYSGLEVCQRLKESQETARIPVLLSVGKLEPFKPEEAQRVRADGFIVKPFEASELLSALSKLEDKVVPRAEPSKPGRFARAIAAAEESSRGGGSTAGEKNGWKNRIGFPQEKTEPAEKIADESSIYNSMNRDLRTVVETAGEKAAEQTARQKEAEAASETSVDVVALAPAGLPTDVTPEEVAAIAAAAAQIQMAGAAIKDESEVSDSRIADRAESNQPAQRDESISLVNGEAKTESLAENESEVAGEAAAADTDHLREGDSRPEELQDVPVTMAATAESVVADSSRWTAVPVAMEGDEASISLEQEMQKASAAFAAAAISESESELVSRIEPPIVADVTAPEPARLEQSEAAPSSFGVAIPASVTAAPVEGTVGTSPTTEFAEVNQEPSADEFMSPVSEAEVAGLAGLVGLSAESQLAPEVQVETAKDTTASSKPFVRIVRADEDIADPGAGPKPESETVKTTAAAWASWRQTRDSDNGEAVQTQGTEFQIPESAPAEAARAVAAGAEQIAQESATAVSGENPADVASIVDSVLADLRPKLMAEISRKMAEKK